MLGQYTQSLIPERRVADQRYRLADAAYKVVGVGSVGTLCGVALMVSGDGETLQLQFKEAEASVLESGQAGPSPYANHGERVVRGQRLLQAACDILLGFGTGPTRQGTSMSASCATPRSSRCSRSVGAQFPPLCRDLRRGAGARPCPLGRRRRACRPISAKALLSTRRSARSPTSMPSRPNRTTRPC